MRKSKLETQLKLTSCRWVVSRVLLADGRAVNVRTQNGGRHSLCLSGSHPELEDRRLGKIIHLLQPQASCRPVKVRRR